MMSERDVIDRLDRGEVRFRMIDENMRAIRDTMMRMEEQQKAMAAKVDRAVEEVEKTKEIVEAWQFVKTGGKFSKWLAGIIAAIGVVVSVAKGWWIK